MGRFLYLECTTEQESFRIVKTGLFLMNGVVDCTSMSVTLGVLKGHLLQGVWVAMAVDGGLFTFRGLVAMGNRQLFSHSPSARVAFSPCKCIAPDPCPVGQLHHDSIVHSSGSTATATPTRQDCLLCDLHWEVCRKSK